MSSIQKTWRSGASKTKSIPASGASPLRPPRPSCFSAGVRAIPIGQTDGPRVVAALGATIDAVIAEAAAATLDDLGGAALRADIASMKHETQYTRLFRS